MGKAEDQQNVIADSADGGGGGGAGGGRRRRCAAVSPRCVAVLLLSASLLLSALFLLPPFYSKSRDRFRPDNDSVGESAEIKASFILQKPFSQVVSHVSRLEYEILEEIGVPNTKVSVTSMHSLAATNSTYVAFAVSPNSKHTSISLPALSVLRSSLVELVLQQLNLSLTPSFFGQAISFEVLKFPGGITLIPVQSASIWEITKSLFRFDLNNSIIQIQKNLEELKDQLKFGLNLRSYENVYVQMTNANGSTVEPPVTVQASVLSDSGRRSLLPSRLKQLAQVITGPHEKNLGLNHTVFGKVKKVQLSSYLQYSISTQGSPGPSPSRSPSPSPSPPLSPCPPPPPSPSLSPSPSPSSSSSSSPSPSPSPQQDLTYPAPPLSSHPSHSLSHAPVPSTNSDNQPPWLYCHKVSPTGSPLLYAPGPAKGPQPPSQFFNSPEHSVPNLASPPRCGTYTRHPRPPDASPIYHAYPPISTHNVPNSASPTSTVAPEISPLSSAGPYRSHPLQDKGSGVAPTPSVSTTSMLPPPPSYYSVAHHNYGDTWLIGLLLEFLTFQFFLHCCALSY